MVNSAVRALLQGMGDEDQSAFRQHGGKHTTDKVIALRGSPNWSVPKVHRE